MLDFYYWPTPNGWKVAMLLEELKDHAGVDYRLVPVNIGKGDQFTPEFLAISPNNRMPAIVDNDPSPEYGPEPVPVFESGAIMLYLADKFGMFGGTGARVQKEVMEWLFWQTGNQGPMGGQLSHFVNYAPKDKDNSYSEERYRNEYDRCLGVLDRRLEGREWIAGDEYTIADMMNWPWVLIAKPLTGDLEPYKNVARWRSAIKDRATTKRAVDLGKDLRQKDNDRSDEDRARLFRQTGKLPGA